MPHIYVTPTIDPVLVMKRGVISVPGDKGMLYKCNGTIENNMIQNNSANDKGGGLADCNSIIKNNTIF